MWSLGRPRPRDRRTRADERYERQIRWEHYVVEGRVSPPCQALTSSLCGGVGELARSVRVSSCRTFTVFTLERTCRNEGCVAQAAAVGVGGGRSRRVSGPVFEERIRGHREDLPAPAKPEEDQEFCRPGSEHKQHLWVQRSIGTNWSRSKDLSSL